MSFTVSHSYFHLMKKILLLCALCALCASFFSGCTTTSTSNTTATVSSTLTAHIDSIASATKLVFKYATSEVLANNPSYSSEVAAVNAGIAAIFCGGNLTTATVSTQLAALAPSLTAAQLAEYSSAVVDAWSLLTQALGTTTLISTDEDVAKLLKAITDGIAAGVTLHNSSTSTAS